ncbi:MAG: radical SAM protein [Candidatus Hydrothermota bacterium]|nr:MAG: radical SAM protein [Candidatus Hydrothermae bacterium]
MNKLVERVKAEGIVTVLKALISTEKGRDYLLKKLDDLIFRQIVLNNPKGRPHKVQEDKYHMLMSIAVSAFRNIERGYFSRAVANKMIESLVKGALLHSGADAERAFREQYGFYPPSFLTISPGKACNLRCIGCYAASGANLEKLRFDVFERIVREAHDFWGSRFIVISGGEPTIYRDNGKTVFDLYEMHPDMYFLMYTNGTTIDKAMAKRMAELGNITPAISVEGYEKETDERRGKGVFKKVLAAMDNLREFGVPFGISVTVTRLNAPLLMKTEFYEYYFEELGATYAWLFHYMPIGRQITLDLMPTPEQRVALYWKWREMVREKRYFVADFWNSGVVSDGCIAAGRPGGYLYIDWNGYVMPCVFIPYYVSNINEIYANGGNLNDAIVTPFFEKIRRWQHEYGYKFHSTPGNWLMPCMIRDHHAEFRKIADEVGVKPEDENADAAFKDPNYYKGLVEYDNRLKELTEPIWKEVFLEVGKKAAA